MDSTNSSVLKETLGYKYALTSGVCNICGKKISIGEACSPSEKSGWVHFACFQGSMEKLAICGFYRRFSKCVHEKNCAYSHLLINVPFRRKRKKKRLKTWNKERATILRIFLLKNYGEEFLKQGSGILDVAGGNGMLSFEMLNLNDIPVTVLDPRPLCLANALNRWEAGVYKKFQFAAFTSRNLESHTEPSFPKQIRLCLDNKLIEKLNEPEAEDFFIAATSKVQRMKWDRGLEVTTSMDKFQNDFQSCVDSWSEVRNAILSCSIIVGLHPDQATSPIVNLALSLNKPFIIIPCCVFWKQFPRRKLMDGTQVKTHDQLIQWCREQNPNIQETILEFEGKNQTLFLLPKR